MCIDGRLLDREETGVARYASTLVHALRRGGVEPLVLRDEGIDRRRRGLDRLLAAALPSSRNLTGDRSLSARDIFREAQVHFGIYGRLRTLVAPGPPGIMHWTYPLPLRIAGWRNIYTVHDVIPLDPTIASPVDGPRLERLLDMLVKTADRLVAVSEAARRDIVARLGCPPALVTTCLPGVDVDVDEADEPDLGRPVAGPYLLYVGAIEHRKNLVRLIEAHRRSGIPTPLLLVGPDGLGSADVMRAVAGATGVRRLGFQPRSALLRLIAEARAMLFPTLAEGFGLPVAEAMALGTPVLTSSGGATEEIGGDAVLTVDPRDVDALAQAIARLDRDGDLRARLAVRGRERAVVFGPEPYARRLLALYADLCR